MSKAITKSILFISVVLLSGRVSAQQWLGRTTGNYSGTYGLYNNASSIADSKYRYYFNFWGRGVNFYNNGVLYNAPIKLNQWANGTYDIFQQRLDGKPDYQKDWLKERLNDKDKQFSFNQDIWGPAFMFPISNRVNMSINTRQRNSLQIFGITAPFARMAFNGLDSSGGIYDNNGYGLNRNTTYNIGKFGVNAQSYQELSFSFAGILAQNKKNKLNGGLSVKFIRGLGAAYVKGSGFDMAITGDRSVQIQNADIQYAYTDDKSVIEPFNKPYGLFTLQSQGFGAGIDVGLTYTHTGNPGKYARSNKYCNNNIYKSDYDFKLAAAFNDLGGIGYNKDGVKYSYSNTGLVNLTVPSSVLNGFNQPTQNAFDTIGKAVFGQMGATRQSGFGTSLPASFNLQMDFRMSEHLYTSVYWNQSMKGANSTGMRSTSMLSVIPRIESRGFEFSMPLTLSENYKNFYVGAYARFGPVFIGSDNLGGLINVAANTPFRGADIYGGVSFGIGHCHRWWYENKVEPTHIDTVTQKDSLVQRDTIKTEKRDTIKIIKRDTIKVHDTVYIKKNGEKQTKIIRDTVYLKSKELIEKENDLKRREEILINRQKQLEQREKVIQEKEKGTYNESEDTKNCKTQNAILTTENVNLKNKTTAQAQEIDKLKQQIDELNKNKAKQDAEIAALKNCNNVLQYDEGTGKILTPCQLYEKELAKRKQCETASAEKDATINRLNTDILRANKTIAELQVEIAALKKGGVKNSAEPVKGTDAEKLLKAQKQIDSLNLKVIGLQAEIDKCKKTATQSEAQAQVKSLEEQAVILKAQIAAAKKKNDSLAAVLVAKNAELLDCQKKAGSESVAELVKARAAQAKAEAQLGLANKKSDSLQLKLTTVTADLDNCRKSNGTSEADIAKLKKCEEEKALYKAELDAANKNALRLNAKIYQSDAKIDSLQNKLTTVTAELDNCKKNSSGSSSEADIAKLKKCEDEKTLYKAELDAANKTILTLNAKIYKLDYKMDSLTAELVKCNSTSGNNDAELLKKCNETKAQMEAEISGLKNRVSATAKSLDSLKTVTANLTTAKATLEAEVADLKAKSNTANCDEYIKQIEAKNITINNLNSQNTTLQSKVNSLSAQLKELQTEYKFISEERLKCSKKLDSCMNGLFQHDGEGTKTPPGDGSGSGSGSGGPSEEGSLGSNDTFAVLPNSSNTNNTATPVEKKEKKEYIGLKILGEIVETILTTPSSTTTTPTVKKPSSTTTTTPNTTTGRSGGTTTGTKRPSETGSGSGSGSTTTTTTTTNTTTNNSNATTEKRRGESTSGSGGTTTTTPKPTTPKPSGTGTTTTTNTNTTAPAAPGNVNR